MNIVEEVLFFIFHLRIVAIFIYMSIRGLILEREKSLLWLPLYQVFIITSNNNINNV